jgi:hypothetical protein
VGRGGGGPAFGLPGASVYEYAHLTVIDETARAMNDPGMQEALGMYNLGGKNVSVITVRGGAYYWYDSSTNTVYATGPNKYGIPVRNPPPNTPLYGDVRVEGAKITGLPPDYTVKGGWILFNQVGNSFDTSKLSPEIRNVIDTYNAYANAFVTATPIERRLARMDEWRSNLTAIIFHTEEGDIIPNIGYQRLPKGVGPYEDYVYAAEKLNAFMRVRNAVQRLPWIQSVLGRRLAGESSGANIIDTVDTVSGMILTKGASPVGGNDIEKAILWNLRLDNTTLATNEQGFYSWTRGEGAKLPEWAGGGMGILTLSPSRLAEILVIGKNPTWEKYIANYNKRGYFTPEELAWADKNSRSIYGVISDPKLEKYNPATGRMEKMYGRLYIKGTFTLPNGKTVTNPIPGIDDYNNYIVKGDVAVPAWAYIYYNIMFGDDPTIRAQATGFLEPWIVKAKPNWMKNMDVYDWYVNETAASPWGQQGITRLGAKIGPGAYITGWWIYDPATKTWKETKEFPKEYATGQWSVLNRPFKPEVGSLVKAIQAGKELDPTELSQFMNENRSYWNQIEKELESKYGHDVAITSLRFDAQSGKWLYYDARSRQWLEGSALNPPSPGGVVSITLSAGDASRMREKDVNDLFKGLTGKDLSINLGGKTLQKWATEQVRNLTGTNATVVDYRVNSDGNVEVVCRAEDGYHTFRTTLTLPTSQPASPSGSSPAGPGLGSSGWQYAGPHADRPSSSSPAGPGLGSSGWQYAGPYAGGWQLWPSLELQPSRFRVEEKKPTVDKAKP